LLVLTGINDDNPEPIETWNLDLVQGHIIDQKTREDLDRSLRASVPRLTILVYTKGFYVEPLTEKGSAARQKPVPRLVEAKVESLANDSGGVGHQEINTHRVSPMPTFLTHLRE
jgi:hypothetical protein